MWRLNRIVADAGEIVQQVRFIGSDYNRSVPAVAHRVHRTPISMHGRKRLEALLKLSNLDRCGDGANRQRHVLAHAGRRVDQRRQRDHPLFVQHQLQRLARTAVVPLFGGLPCSAAATPLLHGSHVRIDVVYGRFTRKTQLWIDVFGTVFFLLPMAILLMKLSWPVFMNAYVGNEVSSNAGGLVVRL